MSHLVIKCDFENDLEWECGRGEIIPEAGFCRKLCWDIVQVMGCAYEKGVRNKMNRSLAVFRLDLQMKY